MQTGGGQTQWIHLENTPASKDQGHCGREGGKSLRARRSENLLCDCVS